MRRDQHQTPTLGAPVSVSPPGTLPGQGLVLKDIEADAADLAPFQRVQQVLFVNQRAPRRVHQDRAGLHLRELCCGDDAARPRREHVVDAEDVGAAEQVFLGGCDLEGSRGEAARLGGLVGLLLRQARAPCQHVHAEAQLARDGGLGAEPSEAQEAQRFAAQRRHESRLPAASVGAGRDVGGAADDVLGESQDQRPRLLVGRVVACRRVGFGFGAHHGDAELRRGRDVDGRVAHPCRHQELELRELAQHRARELRAFSHRRDDREGLQPRDQLGVLRLDFGVECAWEVLDFKVWVRAFERLKVCCGDGCIVVQDGDFDGLLACHCWWVWCCLVGLSCTQSEWPNW